MRDKLEYHNERQTPENSTSWVSNFFFFFLIKLDNFFVGRQELEHNTKCELYDKAFT